MKSLLLLLIFAALSFSQDIFGTIGKQDVSLYKTNYGEIFGTIGEQHVNLFEYKDGTISGKIGSKNVNLFKTSVPQKVDKNDWYKKYTEPTNGGELPKYEDIFLTPNAKKEK